MVITITGVTVITITDVTVITIMGVTVIKDVTVITVVGGMEILCAMFQHSRACFRHLRAYTRQRWLFAILGSLNLVHFPGLDLPVDFIKKFQNNRIMKNCPVKLILLNLLINSTRPFLFFLSNNKYELRCWKSFEGWRQEGFFGSFLGSPFIFGYLRTLELFSVLRTLPCDG